MIHTVLRQQHHMISDIATAAGTPLRVSSVRGGFLCLDMGMGKTALGIALQLLRPADGVWRSEGQVWRDSMLDCRDTGEPLLQSSSELTIGLAMLCGPPGMQVVLRLMILLWM